MSPVLQITLFSILAFLIVSSPSVYKLTNASIGKLLHMPFVDDAGAPTTTGRIVHALVAGALISAYLLTFSF